VRNVMEGMMILGVVLIVLLLWQPYVRNFGATLLYVVKLSCLFTLRVLREDLRVFAISENVVLAFLSAVGVSCGCAVHRGYHDTATVVLVLVAPAVQLTSVTTAAT
jgi:hypothetical protein